MKIIGIWSFSCFERTDSGVKFVSSKSPHRSWSTLYSQYIIKNSTTPWNITQYSASRFRTWFYKYFHFA